MLAILLNKILGIAALVLFLLGIPANLLTCCICMRKQLRSTSTFIFLAILSLNDMISLAVWNLDSFFQAYFNWSHEQIFNLTWCRLCVFLQYFSLEYSAWLLVFICVERYLSIRVKNWRTVYFNSKHSLIAAIALGAGLFALNSHLLYYNGYYSTVNGTQVLLCYQSEILGDMYIPIWHFIHGILYSIIPFLILAIFNTLLILRAITSGPKCRAFSQAHAARKAKHRTLTYTVSALTLMFALSTLPYTLITALWFQQLYKYPLGKLLVHFLNILSFSYHSLNFLALFITNKKFCMEFKRMFTIHDEQNNNNTYARAHLQQSSTAET